MEDPREIQSDDEFSKLTDEERIEPEDSGDECMTTFIYLVLNRSTNNFSGWWGASETWKKKVGIIREEEKKSWASS